MAWMISHIGEPEAFDGEFLEWLDTVEEVMGPPEEPPMIRELVYDVATQMVVTPKTLTHEEANALQEEVEAALAIDPRTMSFSIPKESVLWQIAQRVTLLGALL